MTDADISAAWDAQALTLDDARRATGAHDLEMTRACVDAIQTWIPPSLESLRLLEIGCGIGRLTFPMARALPRSTILGVDASPKMLAYAKATRDKFYRDSGARFMQSCRPGPHGFGEGVYDGAWSVLTFQHLDPDLARDYVVAVGRALKPGGRFVFQFIEGDERQPLSNHFLLGDVCAWLGEGRFSVVFAERGVGHDLWTWIAAEKRAD